LTAEKSERANAADTPERSKDSLRSAERLVYEHQRRRLEDTYSDFEGIDDVRDFFFEMIYPPPEARARFAARNRSIRRITRSWLFRITFHPITFRIAKQIIELEDITESINRRIARELCARGPLPDSIDDDTYCGISREVSTLKQRMRQLENACDGLHYGQKLVEYFPSGVGEVLRFVPKPLLRYSELIDFGIKGYNCLSNHVDELETFRHAIRDRETVYINRMFNVEEEVADGPERGD